MKRNTFYVDNRAEWEIKKIISENDINNKQLKNLFETTANAKLDLGANNIVTNLRSALTSFTYIFN